jgi:hypothetical protein
MEVTYGVRYMPSLERWVVENPKMSEAGGLTPKIRILSSPAQCETVYEQHSSDLWGEVYALVREVSG